MSVILKEAAIHTKVMMREPSSAFWDYVFPTMLLVLFCSVFGNSPEDNTAMLSGVICINSMTGGLYGVGLNIVALREQKILRRYKVTPVPLWKVLLGICLSQVFITTLTTLLLLVVARVVYKVTMPSNVAGFVLVFGAGTFMFCTVAFVIASVARSGHQASALTQVIFMPMIFLSGSTLPYEAMPGWIQKIATALPATYYVSGLRQVFSGGTEGNLANLVMMGVFSLLAAAISVKFFRWE
jgi:ABC-2 type transport system permease protein